MFLAKELKERSEHMIRESGKGGSLLRIMDGHSRMTIENDFTKMSQTLRTDCWRRIFDEYIINRFRWLVGQNRKTADDGFAITCASRRNDENDVGLRRPDAC